MAPTKICLYMGLVIKGGVVSYWQSIIKKMPEIDWQIFACFLGQKEKDLFSGSPVKVYDEVIFKNIWKTSIAFFRYLRKEKPATVIITCGINEVLIFPAILISRIWQKQIRFHCVYGSAALIENRFRNRTFWILMSFMALFHHRNTFVSCDTKGYWWLIRGQAQPLPVFSRSRYPVPYAKNIKVGFLSRHSWEKGPDFFMETVKYIKQLMGDSFNRIEFIVAGEGPLTIEMKKHNCARDVQFIGWIDNATDFLSQIDILLITSRHEGYPMICLEALEAGVSFLGFKVGGIPEILSKDNQKWLTKRGDCFGLAQKVVLFLNNYLESYEAYFSSQIKVFYNLDLDDKERVEKEWISKLLSI